MATRRWLVPTLGATLALSVAGNLWQARRGPGAPTTTAGSTGAAAAAPPAARTAPLAPTRPRSAPRSPAPPGCEALAERLDEAETELEALRPMPDTFAKRTEVSEEVEARVRSAFEHALAGAPPSVSHQFECRGDICRLDVLQPAGKERWDDWTERIQSSPERGLFLGMQFGGGDDAVDPITDERVIAMRMYARVAPPAAGAAATLLEQLRLDLAEAPEVAACKRANPTAGRLILTLLIDPAARTIRYEAEGPLTTEPSGPCILAVLDRLIGERAVAVTADMPEARRRMAIDVP